MNKSTIFNIKIKMLLELLEQSLLKAEKNLKNPNVLTNQVYMLSYCSNNEVNLLFAENKEFHKVKYLGHLLDLHKNKDVLNFVTAEGPIISLFAADYGARWFLEPIDTFLGINLEIEYNRIIKAENIKLNNNF